MGHCGEFQRLVQTGRRTRRPLARDGRIAFPGGSTKLDHETETPLAVPGLRIRYFVVFVGTRETVAGVHEFVAGRIEAVCDKPLVRIRSGTRDPDDRLWPKAAVNNIVFMAV